MFLDRYSNPVMSKIWSDQNRFDLYLKIEKLVAIAESELGIIPSDKANIINSEGSFSLERVYELDGELKHETLAFLTNVSENISKIDPSAARFLHYGLTSSDLLDTAFSMQLRDSVELIISNLRLFLEVLKKKAFEHKYTICIGRSHGIHGEPITFGLKMAYAYSEFRRHLQRLISAKEQVSICMISGPMGNYSGLSPEVQDLVADRLGLDSETVSTQVIARDRFAEYFCVLGIIASSIERIATEVRHLQRTEVGEVMESFTEKQKGSSAMPHKKNPILSENLCGLARIVRSTIIPALENINLWHERDMSHSSVERLLAPEANILCDFMLTRVSDVISILEVNADQMRKNLSINNYSFLSHQKLLNLIESGISREDAYKQIQDYYFKSDFNNGINMSDDDLLPYIKHIDYIFTKVFVD